MTTPGESRLRGPAFEEQIVPRDGLRPSLGELRTLLGKIDSVPPRDGVSRLLGEDAIEGIKAAGALIEAYGSLTSAEVLADRRWLTRDRPPEEATRDAFAILMIAGLVSRLETPPENYGPLVTRLMFGSDPSTTLFRDVLLGNPVPEDEGLPWHDLADGFHIPFDELNKRPCIYAVQTSLTHIGIAAAGLPRPHPRAGAVITSIAPDPAAPGETVVIRGRGLGLPDPAALLMFGTKAAVTTFWTDTEIHAVVPQLQGDCCVSIIEQAVATGDNIGLLLDSTTELSGALGDCFGPAGVAAAARFGKIPFGLTSAEATCQPDRRNALWTGPPQIAVFSANDDASGTYIWRPHKPLTLRWTVERADSAGMTATPVVGTPPASVTPYLPSGALPQGSQSFAALNSVAPWRSRYTLTATNRCGTSRADLDLQFLARIAVIAVSGGLRCSFQSGALVAMGGLMPTEPAVYGASGFGALTVRTAAANFRNPQPLRDFWDKLTTPDDFFAVNTIVNQLSTVDGAKYKTFLSDAGESSEIMALGFGARAGTYLTVPEVNYGEIWWRNGLALTGSMVSEAASDIGPAVSEAVLGASESAASSFPWAALILFALRVGVDIGVATDIHNKIAAAVAQQGIKDPAALLTAIDELVAAAGPVQPGVKLRIALGNLESGDVNYAWESGAIVAQPLGSLVASGSLTQILKASVSTPSLLPFVKIDANHFVDGATIDPAPLDAVVDAGADHVYILQPNSRFLAPIDSFDQLGFLMAERRAMQMRERGFLSAALAPHERWPRRDNGVPVVGDLRISTDLIEATVDLAALDAFGADNGLIAIWSDYGYLRAFDVLAPPLVFPDESQQDDRAALARQLASTSDNLTAARYFCWSVEHTLNGSFRYDLDLGPDPEIVAVSSAEFATDMRSVKRAIRQLIDQRLRLVHDAPRTKGGQFPPIAAVPGNYADWFMKWEQHYWTEWFIYGNTPWDELGGFGDGSGDVPAETPPAPIDAALLQP